MPFHWGILLFTFLIYQNLSNGDADPAQRIAEEISTLGRKLITSLKADSAANENLLISPTNIFHAVALLYMAAGGNTLKELSPLMGIPENRNYSKSDIRSNLSAFYKSIITDDKRPAILNIADALFLQNGFQIKKDYLDFTVQQFGAQIENVDFNAGKEAVDKINQWVAEKTRNRIQKVVDGFNADTQAVIISTLYFNAKWATPFEKAMTQKDKFSTGASEVDVQMMKMVGNLLYVNNTELQFESIEFPYKTSNYVLNIILPYPNQTIKNLIPQLKDINMIQLMVKQQYENVEAKLPKTKFNVGQSLVKSFQQLGVQELFSGANLTDLTDAKVGISQIFHCAEMEIDEEGTVATAVTASDGDGGAAPMRKTTPIPFHINRPFIMNIYNRKTALTLFSSIIYKPQ